MLYYANDLLTICTSVEQIKKVINVISKWSKKNGMLLNKKKSGIVIFARRKADKIPMMKLLKGNLQDTKTNNRWVPAQVEIEGMPVCSKYKYLGTFRTPKLTCGEQIAFIKRKSAHIFVKFYPYLKKRKRRCKKRSVANNDKTSFRCSFRAS